MFSSKVLRLITNTSKYVPYQYKNLHSFACILGPNNISSTHNRGIDFCFPKKVNLDICRSYAKSKDKGKDKKGKGGKVEVRASDISNVVNLADIKSDYQRHIDNLKSDFIENLSIRSATGSIESLNVSFENKEYELQELAQIVRKNPKTVILHMTSFPQAIPNILKAIADSGLNLNPQQDGTSVFIPVPKVTKEHRENLAKNAKIIFYKCRDGLKNVENEYIKKTKKTALSEDMSRNIQKQISAVGEGFHVEARTLLNKKTLELVGKE